MDEIIKILMHRDNISYEDARERIRICEENLEDAIKYGDYEMAMDIISNDLGLEPDYLPILLSGVWYNMNKYTIVGLMTVHNKLVQVRHEVTEDPIYIASKLYITHGWIANSKGDVIYIIDDNGNISNC